MSIRPILELRARVRAGIRGVFDAAGFLEVDTPVLSGEVLPEPFIDPIPVPLAGADRRPQWLQASPEALMKRLLAAGSGPIWQFARSFRAGERGRLHDIEFVLVEWYAPGGTLADNAALVDRLCAATLGSRGVERLDCRRAFADIAGVDLLEADVAALATAGTRLGLAPPPGVAAGVPPADAWDRWFELLLAEVVGPSLGHRQPTLLEDWPASQAAFARLHPEDPRVARRFELFIAGVEIANGWEEETRREVLADRIAASNRIRAADGRGVLPVPERLLEAHGPAMPGGVGAALGFDRLAMLAAGADGIDAVRCFRSGD
jgi:elongation factor P--(R)-beta-lysine ligase